MEKKNVKPIFHWKLCSRRLPNANESDTDNMKSTWPMQKFCVGDPTRPIFNLFAMGVCVGCNANFSVCFGDNTNVGIFRCQHVGIPFAKLSCCGYCQMRQPNASV